jgi:outer membrane murein-binding lipoprotein Lpp
MMRRYQDNDHTHITIWVAIAWSFMGSSCLDCSRQRARGDELETEVRQLRSRVDLLEADDANCKRRMGSLETDQDNVERRVDGLDTSRRVWR